MTKRIIALIGALAISLNIFPFAVFAEGEEGELPGLEAITVEHIHESEEPAEAEPLLSEEAETPSDILPSEAPELPEITAAPEAAAEDAVQEAAVPYESTEAPAPIEEETVYEEIGVTPPFNENREVEKDLQLRAELVDAEGNAEGYLVANADYFLRVYVHQADWSSVDNGLGLTYGQINYAYNEQLLQAVSTPAAVDAANADSVVGTAYTAVALDNLQESDAKYSLTVAPHTAIIEPADAMLQEQLYAEGCQAYLDTYPADGDGWILLAVVPFKACASMPAEDAEIGLNVSYELFSFGRVRDNFANITSLGTFCPLLIDTLPPVIDRVQASACSPWIVTPADAQSGIASVALDGVVLTPMESDDPSAAPSYKVTKSGTLTAADRAGNVTTQPLTVSTHSLKATVAKAPTCTVPGYKAYWTCQYCEQLFADSAGKTIIDNPEPTYKAHTLTAIARKAPTCTAPGYEAYWKCTVCQQLFNTNQAPTDVNVIEAPVVIAPTGHNWKPAVFTWNKTVSGAWTATATRTCAANVNHKQTVTAEVTRVDTAPTCTEAGKYTYTAAAHFAATPDFSDEAVEENIAEQVLPALGHEWVYHYDWEPVYATDEDDNILLDENDLPIPALAGDGSPLYTGAVTVTRTCSRHIMEGEDEVPVHEDDLLVDAPTRVVVAAKTTVPVCVTPGKTVYTATATFADGKISTDTVSNYISAPGHNWKPAAFVWNKTSSGAWTATATRICAANGYHKQTTAAEMTTLYKAPRCTETGKYEYTATAHFDATEGFEDAAEPFDIAIQTLPAVGHDWVYRINWEQVEILDELGDPTGLYEYTGRVESAVRVCNREVEENGMTVPVHEEEFAEDALKVTVTAATTKPTCTADGKTVYTAVATYSGGKTFTDKLTVAIPALGHDWQVPTFTWTRKADGTYTAVARRICGNANHPESKNAVMTRVQCKETEDPTCVDPGYYLWTADVSFDEGACNYSEEKQDPLKATGHKWGAATIEWYDVDDPDQRIVSVNGSVPENLDNTHTYACRAYRYCENGGERQDLTVKLVSRSTATCEKDGIATYTATITGTGFSARTATFSAPAVKLGHDWNEPVFTWNKRVGNYTVTVRRTCKNGNHPQTLPVTVECVACTATCQTAGVNRYMATAMVDEVPVVEFQEEPVKALGHKWVYDYDWQLGDDLDDYDNRLMNGQVIATRTCTSVLKNGETAHVPNPEIPALYVPDDVRSEYAGRYEYSAPRYVAKTCVRNGSYTYICKVTYADGTVKSINKVQTLLASGHHFDEPVGKWTERANAYTYAESHTCNVCRAKQNASVRIVKAVAPATCIATGLNTYTATVSYADLAANDRRVVNHTDTTVQGNTEVLKRVAHRWTAPVFKWDPDDPGHLLPVTATCSVGQHDINYMEENFPDECGTPEIIAKDTSNCTTAGLITYTARYKLPGLATVYSNTNPVKGQGSILGHNWNNEKITYTWTRKTDGRYVVTAKRLCQNNAAHYELVANTPAQPSGHVDPTCTAPGSNTFTVEITFPSDGYVAIATRTDVLKAVGHKWRYDGIRFDTHTEEDTPVFDGTAWAVRTCLNDCHIVEQDGTAGQAYAARIAERTTSNCLNSGIRTFTASYTFADARKAVSGTFSQPDPALGHSWKAPTVVWAKRTDGTYIATMAHVCARNTAHVERLSNVEAVLIEDVLPTCTTAGRKVYRVEGTFPSGDTATFTRTDAVRATGHKWAYDPIRFDQTVDGYTGTASAVRHCENERHEGDPVQINPIAMVTQKTTATCETAGIRTFTAAYTFSDTRKAVSGSVTQPEAALGHSWQNPTFAWVRTAGNHTAKATRVCTRNSRHVQVFDATPKLVGTAEFGNTGVVEIAKTVSMPVTCTKNGINSYRATLRLDGVLNEDGSMTGGTEHPTTATISETQRATGHKWVITYDWETMDADGLTVAKDLPGKYYTGNVTVTRVCSNPAHRNRYDDHIVADAVVDSEILHLTATLKKVNSTCVRNGTETYTVKAVFANGNTATASKINNLGMTGHEWGPAVFTWTKSTGTNYVAKATRACLHNPAEKQIISKVIGNPVLTIAPTCTSLGEKEYTAALTFADGTPANDVFHLPVAMLAHKLSPAADFAWNMPASVDASGDSDAILERLLEAANANISVRCGCANADDGYDDAQSVAVSGKSNADGTYTLTARARFEGSKVAFIDTHIVTVDGSGNLTVN